MLSIYIEQKQKVKNRTHILVNTFDFHFNSNLFILGRCTQFQELEAKISCFVKIFLFYYYILKLVKPFFPEAQNAKITVSN